MAAIQFMRGKPHEAGNLQTTPQQTVATQGNAIDIQPANPDVVYVPDYDPESVYGYPIGLWPGFSPWWGVREIVSPISPARLLSRIRNLYQPCDSVLCPCPLPRKRTRGVSTFSQAAIA